MQRDDFIRVALRDTSVHVFIPLHRIFSIGFDGEGEFECVKVVTVSRIELIDITDVDPYDVERMQKIYSPPAG